MVSAEVSAPNFFFSSRRRHTRSVSAFPTRRSSDLLNLPFKALMFLTLMRPSLVLFLVLWLKLVKDFLKVRCRLALLPFLISCLIWLDLVASLPLIKERILLIILLLHFLDRKSGSAGMPRPISYAVFCLKKKKIRCDPHAHSSTATCSLIRSSIADSAA